MPKDHYIAQTYLRQFLDPTRKGQLNCYRKPDGTHFTPPTDKVCCEEGWDTNPFFPKDDRVIENFLQVIEPQWTNSINDIHDLPNLPESKYLMAGYLAVMAACSPTAVRLGGKQLSEQTALTAQMIMKQAQEKPEHFPELKPLPSDIYNILTQKGGIEAIVDQKYPHALAIKALCDMQWTFFKSHWIVMFNDTDNLFVTSDFPVCYHYMKPEDTIATRYVPITPRISILIVPSIEEEDRHMPEKIDKWPQTITTLNTIKPQHIPTFNRLVVKSAERLVISSQHTEWLPKIVKKFGDWGMQAKTTRIPVPKGHMLLTRYDIGKATKKTV